MIKVSRILAGEMKYYLGYILIAEITFLVLMYCAFIGNTCGIHMVPVGSIKAVLSTQSFYIGLKTF